VTDQDGKVRENRVRRAAERQGLRLEKSRRRDPRALGYDTYRLVNVAADDDEGGLSMGLDEVEARLSGQAPTDARAEAFDKLLAAVQTLGEFWEARVTGDQLDNVDLMDIVLNTAEHAAAGGDQPVCGKVGWWNSPHVCGRVAGHDGDHRGDSRRWSDDTTQWGEDTYAARMAEKERQRAAAEARAAEAERLERAWVARQATRVALFVGDVQVSDWVSFGEGYIPLPSQIDPNRLEARNDQGVSVPDAYVGEVLHCVKPSEPSVLWPRG
jgi:hypothetical protein